MREKYQLDAGIPVEVVYFGYLKNDLMAFVTPHIYFNRASESYFLVDANSETDIVFLHKKYHC